MMHGNLTPNPFPRGKGDRMVGFGLRLNRRTLTCRRLRPPAASPVKITGEVWKEPGFFASL
jgi:hypothetical protein